MTLFTSFISTTAFAAAMHIQFVIVVILFTIETLLALFVMQRGFKDFNDADEAALMSITVVLYFVALWAIHTAQYNTAMMYIFDRHYQEEKMEKQLQQKVQELQRIHLANTLHEIGSPLQAFVNGLDDIKENCASISSRPGFDLQETLGSMEASVALISLARRRAIAYAKPSSEEGSALQPVLSEVDVRQLLQECWKVVQGKACALQKVGLLSLFSEVLNFECLVVVSSLAMLCSAEPESSGAGHLGRGGARQRAAAHLLRFRLVARGNGHIH
jgi:signal transduction histidine kinase